MFKAFLDDFRLVRIETTKYNEKHWIWDSEKSIEFVISNSYQINSVKIYELILKTDWDFTRDYYIYNSSGDRCIIAERNIVRLKQFDELFYYDGKLGSFYTPKKTIFKLWAPISREVLIKLNPNKGPLENKVYRLNRSNKGVFIIVIEEDLQNYHYTYIVKSCGKWIETIDPYGKATRINSTSSCIVKPEDISVPKLENKYLVDNVKINDSIIYELHIRDFSINPNFNFESKGKYNSFSEKKITNSNNTPIGLDYLISLGITHLQLMPIFDFSSVTEFHFDDAYNWGYDPEQFNVVEGRYSSNAYTYNTRILELKKMIVKLKENNIGVIMDVVYNHVFHYETFAFQKIIPGYFFRFDNENKPFNGSGTGNDIATERNMVRKYILDSLVYWLQEFKVNGFRFDLMGLIDLTTMKIIKSRLREINPNVYLYGEGWNMNTGISEKDCSTIENSRHLPSIGFFNAYFRDIIKGSTFNTKERGLASYNPYLIGTCDNILKASINYQFLNPQQCINYISCHDNLTLYDRFKTISDDESEILKFQKLAYGFLLLSQGVPFIHAGCEFSRTKKGIDNSYKSGDDINQIDWDLIDKNNELVNYVKKLIYIRKKYNCLRIQSSDEINENINTYHDGSIIHYRIKNTSELNDINEMYILFNISNKEVIHHFNIEYTEILFEVQDNCYLKVNKTKLNRLEIKIFIK